MDIPKFYMTPIRKIKQIIVSEPFWIIKYVSSIVEFLMNKCLSNVRLLHFSLIFKTIWVDYISFQFLNKLKCLQLCQTKTYDNSSTVLRLDSNLPPEKVTRYLG